MPHVKFISKAKVDGQEYNKGNTLDVDEATKSRLLKEGCIEGANGSDCSELQDQVISLKEELSVAKMQNETYLKELDNAKKVVDGNTELISGLLSELANAKKLEDFKAIQEKHTKADQ